jgi:thiol-disulfide isomerase/thioredoxin
MRRNLFAAVLAVISLSTATAAVQSTHSTAASAAIVGTAGDPEITAGSSYIRRRGQLVVDPSAPPIVFRLSAIKVRGLFNEPNLPTSFDLNGDGTFDPDLERFLNSERFVTIGNRSFAFVVAADGSRVTLTPIARKRPDRIVLKTGYAAPDFAFTDIHGQRHRLTEFRGKSVFLDFWGVWCGSCVEMAPELVSLYEKYHARGFEILGIEAKDKPAAVLAFTKDKKMPWMQTLEPAAEHGPIATLYRVTGWPTGYLIGPDGTFLSAGYLGEVDLKAELARLFPER